MALIRDGKEARWLLRSNAFRNEYAALSGAVPERLNRLVRWRILPSNAKYATGSLMRRGACYKWPVVVLGDGEHHNAADTALDFLGNCGRMVGLRLHPHAETNKKATKDNLADSAARTSAGLFRSRRRKGR